MVRATDALAPSDSPQLPPRARGFFAWAYKADRVPDCLGDHLPSVRDSPPLPRPVPDTVWRDALAAELLILLDTPWVRT